MKKQFLTWAINDSLKNSQEYYLNNNIAINVADLGYDVISKKYTHILPKDIHSVLTLSDKVHGALSGIGVDIGGGVGSVSSVVALIDNVERIYCVELTEGCVTHCHPIVIPHILGSKQNKVISVVGDFNSIEMPDGSVDFVIAWDALHHSQDMTSTLTEARRVLCEGGHLIVVDRAHNNSTTDEEIQAMLDVKYSPTFLTENFLPTDKVLTRRDNGEHEYRYSEWELFFGNNGFAIVDNFIVRENHPKNSLFANDSNYREIFVDFELGGFERQKVLYLVSKSR